MAMASEPGGSSADDLESFASTGGRIIGILGLVMAAGFAGLWLADRDGVPAAVGAGALVAAVLAWVSQLRPRVSASRETLHLRNMLETVHVPLAAVDELVVRQVLAVRVGRRRFVSPAVGRKLRKVIRAPRSAQILGPVMPESMVEAVGTSSGTRPVRTNIDYADHVEGRLRELIADARTRHGVTRHSDEAEALARDVRRVPAWPEIVALVLTVGLFVLTLLR